MESGRYFVTVRCSDSLPHEAVLRLNEIAQSIGVIEPHSAAFAALQRESFRTAEKYLDAGHGSCPLRTPAAAGIVQEELTALSEWQVSAPHFTIMPNHWHALIVPGESATSSLSDILKRVKGRTAKRIRRMTIDREPLWQSERFDRWIRNDAEWERCVAYIHNNPVKAGLARTLQEHPWTK